MPIEITCPYCGEITEWFNVCAILDVCPKCLKPLEQGAESENKGLGDKD
ncbi:MAG: hypothetical protein OS130_10070 [Thermodesulfobacteriota bacterium]|jgi:endogenous inhibitor of DNA gyrase (YacG/DUF329 family)|nr:MAG: hypothetical protein OS130_10070 [Thermodesulfobacteriota bacterium]